MSPSFPCAPLRPVSGVLSLVGALFVLFMATMPASAQAPQDARRPRPKTEMQQAVETYRLSPGDLQKVTLANDRLAAGIAKNPGAVQDLLLRSEKATPDRFNEMVKQAEANPVIASAIHSAGMDVRGYLVVLSAMAGATAYARMMQENPQAGARMSGYLTPTETENVKLLEAHPAEARAFEQSFEKLRQAHEELNKRAHGSGGR